MKKVQARCMICGRPLTSPESIKRLMGPTCAGKAAKGAGASGKVRDMGEGRLGIQVLREAVVQALCIEENRLKAKDAIGYSPSLLDLKWGRASAMEDVGPTYCEFSLPGFPYRVVAWLENGGEWWRYIGVDQIGVTQELINSIYDQFMGGP